MKFKYITKKFNNKKNSLKTWLQSGWVNLQKIKQELKDRLKD